MHFSNEIQISTSIVRFERVFTNVTLDVDTGAGVDTVASVEVEDKGASEVEGEAPFPANSAAALAAWCRAARARFLALAAGPRWRGRRAVPGWPAGGAVDSRCWTFDVAPGRASAGCPSCSSRFACTCPSLVVVVKVA